jgi:hypothetical protein
VTRLTRCQPRGTSSRFPVFQGNLKEVFLNGIVVPTDPRLGVGRQAAECFRPNHDPDGRQCPESAWVSQAGLSERTSPRGAERALYFSSTGRGLALDQIFLQTPTLRSSFLRRRVGNRQRPAPSKPREFNFANFRIWSGRKALFHDFTNASLLARGFDVPTFSPTEAAEILTDLASRYRFTLYEHFITDKIGHDMDHERATRHLPLLAEFISETLKRIDPGNTTFILTSDHGNIEDLSVRNHTLNDVPTMIWGRKKEVVAKQIKDLTNITPAILSLLTR